MASDRGDPVERAAAYRQARIEVQLLRTFELRVRCRTLKRRDLDEAGHAELRAIVEELRARREAVPA